MATRVLVNVLVALPFFAVGVVGLARDDLPDDASAAVPSIGALVVLVGLYVSVLSRPWLSLMPNEETLELRHPSMKPAFARIVMSVPFFLASGIGARHKVRMGEIDNPGPVASSSDAGSGTSRGRLSRPARGRRGRQGRRDRAS